MTTTDKIRLLESNIQDLLKLVNSMERKLVTCCNEIFADKPGEKPE